MALNKQLILIITAVILALLIAASGIYYYLRVKQPAATQPEAQSLGGELFEKSAAPIGEKIQTVTPPPSTNPFETVQTNPFKDVYKNPFE